MTKADKSPTTYVANAAKAAALITSGRPLVPAGRSGNAPLANQAADTQAVVAARHFNAGKLLEVGYENAAKPSEGAQVEPLSAAVATSLVTEITASPKARSGTPTNGRKCTFGSLDRVRTDAAGRF